MRKHSLLFGAGYPTSVYKVYVRASPRAQWWKFDHDISQDVRDPMKYYAGLTVKARNAALWAPIAGLNDYEHDPKKPAVNGAHVAVIRDSLDGKASLVPVL